MPDSAVNTELSRRGFLRLSAVSAASLSVLSFSSANIQQFLQRWQNSRFDLLKMGHNALLQLAMLAHYGQPTAWQHCGYPGPPVLQ